MVPVNDGVAFTEKEEGEESQFVPWCQTHRRILVLPIYHPSVVGS